jgi:transcriptional regulator
MHPSGAFRVTDEATLLSHLAAHPFCTVSASVAGRPLVAHAPVLARREAPGLVLDFHVSRGNALADAIADGFRAIVVSLGPEAYISPDWYEDKDLVPTWNYVSVEAEGPVQALDDAGLAAQLDDLSAQQEALLRPKPPWTRGKMSEGRFERLMRGIIGARLCVERLEGTSKLSQNRRPADRAGVIAALGNHPVGLRMRGL